MSSAKDQSGHQTAHESSVEPFPDCKIEIAVAKLPHKAEGDSNLLSFRKGEKILIDRSVKSSANMIFGRIG